MAMWTVASAVQGARGAGQDRVVTDGDGPRWLMVLADGAGGSGGGAGAAEAVVAGVVAQLRPPASASEIEDCLTACDRAALGGETTALVVVVDGSEVRGASVGDSEAWLVNRRTGDVRVLTEYQVRKPLLGRSEAIVTAFAVAASVDDVLLIGSDGLFKYIARAKLLALVATTDVLALPTALIAAVRLPSGGLQDDVSVIVAAWSEGA